MTVSTPVLSREHSDKKRNEDTHVSIVTALFGTVLTRFTDSPLYSARQPSCVTMCCVIRMSPRRSAVVSCPPFPLRGRFSVWKRVRTTS